MSQELVLSRGSETAVFSDPHRPQIPVNYFVMIPRIEIHQILQPLDVFCRAPRPSTQPFHVVAKHRAGVIQAKQRIKSALL